MTARRIALFTAVAVIALVTGVVLRTFLAEAPVTAKIAAAGPGILAARFPDLQGREQALAQWRGKVMVVNFWATWCPPCRQEIPAFIRVQRNYADRVAFVGIAIDEAEQVRAFADELGINYPVFIGSSDAIELARSAGNAGGGLPFTVILDRHGQVAATRLGAMSESRLQQILADITSR